MNDLICAALLAILTCTTLGTAQELVLEPIPMESTWTVPATSQVEVAKPTTTVVTRSPVAPATTVVTESQPARTVTYYVAPAPAPAATTVYRATYAAPTVVYYPGTTVYRPLTGVTQVTTLSPVAPAVTTTLQPVTTTYRIETVPVVPVGPPVLVREKVLYVPGQPVRNLIRAITP